MQTLDLGQVVIKVAIRKQQTERHLRLPCVAAEHLEEKGLKSLKASRRMETRHGRPYKLMHSKILLYNNNCTILTTFENIRFKYYV